MCGICGFLKLSGNSKSINERLLEQMTDKMALRGPDGRGVWFNQSASCGLGHRRLSIVDLSDTANQPMKNNDGSVVICFNGEIYNSEEIRKEIVDKYHWITDHSDTEMMLHAYEEWGIECIQKFRGIFAFALYDERSNKFYIVRDRIGVKPLYYTIEEDTLVFASEIKAILPALNHKPGIHHQAMYDYLSFLTTPGEQTLFDGILKLRPATYIEYDMTNGSNKKVKYWDVWDHTHPELYNADDETISEAIISELRTAVNYRMVADVPVGVFLSGGIDSSTNAALFSENSKGVVKSFCIGYDQNYSSYKNENHYAKMMAEYCGAEYHERLLTQDDFLDFVPEMVRLQDEPIADPVCVPVYYVSKLARDNGIVVAQVGEGSDELFWGYESWKKFLKWSNMNDKVPTRVLQNLAFAGLNLIGRGRDTRTEIVRRAAVRQPLFWGGAEAFYEYEKRKLVSDSISKELKGYTSFESLRNTYNTFKEKAWEQSNLNWMSYVDLCHRLPELLLMRVDKMSMGVSLEARVPFLDHKFVEIAMSIPEKKKTAEWNSKTVLKQAVRGIIPDEIIDRKKQGFGAPVNDWALDKLGNEMKEKIYLFCYETGLLNWQYINSMFEEKRLDTMWFLYNLAMWWEVYIK